MSKRASLPTVVSEGQTREVGALRQEEVSGGALESAVTELGGLLSGRPWPLLRWSLSGGSQGLNSDLCSDREVSFLLYTGELGLNVRACHPLSLCPHSRLEASTAGSQTAACGCSHASLHSCSGPCGVFPRASPPYFPTVWSSENRTGRCSGLIWNGVTRKGMSCSGVPQL